MGFPDEFVDEVRRSADIVRLISDHLTLKKVGNSWKGLCPFHQEKTPSFNVRADPPVFHCFGCGEGGDVFKFVMLHERVGFPEAIEIVARRFGVPIPERTSAAPREAKEREELLAVLEEAAQWFTRTFWGEPGRAAREYLQGRGFEKSTLDRIRVGAARDAWSALLDDLGRRHSPQVLLAAGLIVARQGKQGHYDRFRNRAVFPILNDQGKVVAFGARALDGSEPKYLNSPESPVYHKASTLYGLSWAKETVRKAGRVILMEGYLDVARALERGVLECVASCGTALTPTHARVLRRFAGRIIVNYDQDAAGQKAATRGIDVLLEQGFEITVVELPEGHDPDSFLKAEGADAYRARLDEAPPYMEWLIRRAARDHDTSTPPGKAAFLNAILPSLAKIENAVERAAWVPVLVQRGRLDGAAAREEVRRAVAARAATLTIPSTTQPPRPGPAPRLLPVEKLLLARLVRGEVERETLSGLEDQDLEGLAAAELLRLARAIARRGQNVTAASLTEAAPDDASRRFLSELAVEGSPAGGQGAAECLKELRRLALERRLEEIQKAIDGAAEGTEALLQEKLTLKRRIATL